ncbi:hypothetical protein AB0945_21120 [Streptomyces sp. NPDC005474]
MTAITVRTPTAGKASSGSSVMVPRQTVGPEDEAAEHDRDDQAT